MRNEPENKEQLKDLRSKLYAQEKERGKVNASKSNVHSMTNDIQAEQTQEEEPELGM